MITKPLNEVVLYLISIFLLLSCNNSKIENSFTLPEDAVKLLAGDGSKTWKLAKRTNSNTRVNMGDCTLAYRQIFLTTLPLEIIIVKGLIAENHGRKLGIRNWWGWKYLFKNNQ